MSGGLQKLTALAVGTIRSLERLDAGVPTGAGRPECMAAALAVGSIRTSKQSHLGAPAGWLARVSGRHGKPEALAVGTIIALEQSNLGALAVASGWPPLET